MNKLHKQLLLSTATIVLLGKTHINLAMHDLHNKEKNLSDQAIQSWSLKDIRTFLNNFKDLETTEIIEPIIQQAAQKITSNDTELTQFIKVPSAYQRSFSLNKQNDPYHERRNIYIQNLLAEKLLQAAPLHMQQKKIDRSSSKWQITQCNAPRYFHEWTIDTPFSLSEVLLLHAVHHRKVYFNNSKQQSFFEKRCLTNIFQSLLQKTYAHFSLDYKVYKAYKTHAHVERQYFDIAP